MISHTAIPSTFGVLGALLMNYAPSNIPSSQQTEESLQLPIYYLKNSLQLNRKEIMIHLLVSSLIFHIVSAFPPCLRLFLFVLYHSLFTALYPIIHSMLNKDPSARPTTRDILSNSIVLKRARSIGILLS